MSIYKNAGLLILGTRMKRISERFLAEVSKVYKEQKIEFEPAWFPILFLLDKKGPLSLTEMAAELEVSHSAVSQMITQLQNKSIVEPVSEQADARVKRIFFTPKGQALLNQTHEVWKALAQTLDQILPKEDQPHFLNSLSGIEDKIASGFLSNHTLSLLAASPVDIVCLEADAKYMEKLQKWAKKRNIELVLNESRFLIATHHNNVIGFATFRPAKDALELEYLFVASEYRRQGVAAKLTETLYGSYLKDTNGCFQVNNPSMELIKLLMKTNYSFKVNQI